MRYMFMFNSKNQAVDNTIVCFSALHCRVEPSIVFCFQIHLLGLIPLCINKNNYTDALIVLILYSKCTLGIKRKKRELPKAVWANNKCCTYRFTRPDPVKSGIES